MPDAGGCDPNARIHTMKRVLWLLRLRLLEIELDGGVPGVRGRLARARAEYCATFAPGVRFIWKE
jgi:hypothetical protein